MLKSLLRRLFGGPAEPAPRGEARTRSAPPPAAARPSATPTPAPAPRRPASPGPRGSAASPGPRRSAEAARPGAASKPPARRGPAPAPRPPRQVPTEQRGRTVAYAPDLDGDADPGEIVWTWVPYEDDPAQGKDRPVLVVGRDGRTLLGLMLSSQGERDGQRNWLALGAGDWDRTQRPSWIRLDRVLEVEEDGIRREGAILDRARFDRVATRLRGDYGWA
ncbi:type II toxin-antitoxin system PemK/MazF family toxin [Actinoplanes teichomyceticus]|uniref:PemK-like, MazF-like toxin of type II toxin-antitoxin system n=1 Tax=Actinoplanes teichomyceticus TaxID=1867 RepID=A0A561VR50_ACTTI|nr:PemK-like, MazF-like toxin of type II toxin-antitoxin system [Actinoplanes teichomyceticus]